MAVPTTRPRHFVTETDELASALDAAAVRWPGLTRSQLLVRLALEGNEAAARTRNEHRAARRAAIRRHAGTLAGVYRVGYLDEIREGWPE